jgi:cytochrome c-type biogenesis protein CcmH/NrfG
MNFFPVVILCLAYLMLAAPARGEDSLFDPGKFMAENARMSDAEEMLRQWLGDHAEDQEARFLLARVLAWQDKRVEALGEYGRLLDDAPDNSDYLLGKALVLVRGGQARSALPLLRKARRLSPYNEQIWRLQIEALRVAGGKKRQQQARLILDEIQRRFSPARRTSPSLSATPAVIVGSLMADALSQQGFRFGLHPLP